MDRYCSHQPPYQPTAGQVYLRCSGSNGQGDDITMTSRPLPAFELEERRREFRLRPEDIWARNGQVCPEDHYASIALHQCRFPLAKSDNGKDNTYQQLPGGIFQHSQRKPRPCPLNLAVEDRGQQQSLIMNHEQHGYLESESADQKRRAARTDLGGQYRGGEGTTTQTTFPPPTPEPTDHRFSRICVQNKGPTQQMQEQSKAPRQQSGTPSYRQWVQGVTNIIPLNSQARQEAAQRQFAQQKRDQQNVQLPAAKPGNQYPRPTRISGPARTVHNNDTERSVVSDLKLSVHLKSNMGYQEKYRMYKAEKERKREEEQRKAILSASTPEATGTESVKQLLASVNKVLEQKVEAAELEAADTKDSEVQAPQIQSQQPHRDPKDAYQDARKCGESFWHEYARSHPTLGPSNGI